MAAISSLKTHAPRRNRWFERIMAIIATINLALVFFDLTYVSWRDFYYQQFPALIQVYDPIKGIEPHRETQQYLDTVEQLEAQVTQTGSQSPEAEVWLQELRLLSNEMIEDNPFAVADKSGHLEKIKNKVRDRTRIKSSHKAFAAFWSQAYLSERGWQPEIRFFNTEIRPLIETNYYRRIGLNGYFVENFWKIDLPFTILFGLEFLLRSYAISRRRPRLNWLQAMLRRWFDLLLLIPFWRWLRSLTVIIRLYQAELVNLEPIREQLNHDFVVNFAEEMTEVIGVRIVNQMQESIRKGEVARWIFEPESRRPYVQVNNEDEVGAIASRLFTVSIYDVLPKVQPEVEALLKHAIETTLEQSPIYQQMKKVPGLNGFSSEVAENFVSSFSKNAYGTLVTALEDPVAAEITGRLSKNFVKSLEVELQKQHNLKEIENLLVDMLEEIKINYVKGIAQGGLEKYIEEAEQIHQITYIPRNV